MNVSIFGLGYVGCVTMGCLGMKGHNVIGVDLNQEKVNQINRGEPTIIEKDISEMISKLSSTQKIKATTKANEEYNLGEDVDLLEGRTFRFKVLTNGGKLKKR